MFKITRKNILLFHYIISAMIFTSCSLNIPPMDMFSDPDAITNVQNARSLLTSAYRAYPHYELEFSILGNDFCPTSLSHSNVELANLYAWRPKEITQLSTNLWLGYYNVIAICDALDERLPQVQIEKEGDKQEIINISSESKLLKAWCYLQLLKIYAPAYDRNPDNMGIILKSTLGIENKQRSSIKECTSYIEDLLLQTAQHPFNNKNQMWMSNDAAHYLLAELYLYMRQWDKVLEYAVPLLSTMPKAEWNSYEKEYHSLWTDKNSTERIFAFYMDSPVFTNLEYDRNKGDLFAVNPTFTIDKSDKRYEMAIIPKKMYSKQVMLLGKYNKLQKDNMVVSYLNEMRRAGLIFMVAEAYAQIGNNYKAIVTINSYRKLTGKNMLTEKLNGKDLVDSILHDKYEEFVGEGINYFDLKRTHNKPLARLTLWGEGHSAYISEDDYRWTFPIPKAEYRFNLAEINQNKGWYYTNDK